MFNIKQTMNNEQQNKKAFPTFHRPKRNGGHGIVGNWKYNPIIDSETGKKE